MTTPARAEPPSAGLFAAVGGFCLHQLRLVGEWGLLWRETTGWLLRGRIDRRQLIRQVDQIGLGSLPLAAVTVTFSSMVLAIYTTEQFVEYGFNDYIGYLIGVGVFRELGPVLTAIVVAAREGSAIAAELATMKVTEQVDALRALATDPTEYLVVPRYVALLIAMPLLTIAASLAGVWGGWVVAAQSGLSQEVYWGSVWRGVELIDFTGGLVKALVFGALIAIVSCHQGLTTGYGAEAVGRSTTASVVICVVLVHIADMAMAVVFN